MDSLTLTPPIHCDNLLLASPFRPPTRTLTLPSNPRPLSSSKLSSCRASSASAPNPVLSAASSALILAAASAALLSPRPAVADPAPETLAATLTEPETLTDSVEFSSETVAFLKSLLYQKLEQGEDSEALAILSRLISAQPSETEWKFLAARILNEMGEAAESRKLYEEILSIDPLSFEALFENAVLMDRCGEGDAVITRLGEALEIAKTKEDEKSVRDVKLIMAQIKYLQRNVNEALDDYEELIIEDVKDYRPYFCQGVILSLLERNEEAREKFAKYKELAPKKFDVDAYLQTPLSQVKLFGTEDSEI